MDKQYWNYIQLSGLCKSLQIYRPKRCFADDLPRPENAIAEGLTPRADSCTGCSNSKMEIEAARRLKMAVKNVVHTLSLINDISE